MCKRTTNRGRTLDTTSRKRGRHDEIQSRQSKPTKETQNTQAGSMAWSIMECMQARGLSHHFASKVVLSNYKLFIHASHIHRT